MHHDIKKIGNSRQEFSNLRKDEKRFSADDFYQFALANKQKYNLHEVNGVLEVSTFYSDNLIKDYIQTIE